MRSAWHDVWGCATGPVARLAPQVRIVGGAGVLAACIAAPTATPVGSVVAATMALVWLCACRPPGRLVVAAAGLSLALLLPYAVVIPLLSSGGGRAAFASSGGLLVRGVTMVVGSIATITTLSASDLREGLVRLPVPCAVSAVLVQIVHQTATLAYETKRVASAMSVRGAAASRLAVWRLLASLPQVWLVRIVERADRVAAAMELRGFSEEGLRRHETTRMRLLDGAVLALVVCALAAALALRWSMR